MKNPIHGAAPVFRTTMSRSRFFNINKFIRFSKTKAPCTPQERLEPFLDLIRTGCKDNLDLGKHIAVNEALVMWKGKLHFKQFIKDKRSKFGIKVFFSCPADSKYQGYA